MRNDYEWDAGHFEGAERPAEEVFHETPVGPPGAENLPEPLVGRDKQAPVMVGRWVGRHLSWWVGGWVGTRHGG